MTHIPADTTGLLEPQPGQAHMVRTAIKDAYPTQPGSYIYCEVVRLEGEEAEGAAGVLVPTGEHLLAAPLNDDLPRPGTQFLAIAVGDQWVLK